GLRGPRGVEPPRRGGRVRAPGRRAHARRGGRRVRRRRQDAGRSHRPRRPASLLARLGPAVLTLLLNPRPDDPEETMSTHDVVIVGARAAGAATALLLARSGHDVVLVDRASFPSDTISTHQISRPGVVSLQRWGLLDAVLASGAPAVRQVTF